MTSEAPELLPCPFCGKPARVFGPNMVGCEDQLNCGANVDWGHYTKGDGPKQAWNKRADLSPQWRPISEAPEGKDLLVCVTHNTGPDEWETVQWVDCFTDIYGWLYFPHLIWVPFPPTHFMPLPEAPK